MGRTRKTFTPLEFFVTAVLPLRIPNRQALGKVFHLPSNLRSKEHVPHFTDDGSETQQLSRLPKGLKLREDRAMIQI